MKKLLLFILCLAFTHLSQAQLTVEKKQSTLLTKKTADWCSSCGSWGWSLFSGLVEDNEENAILIAAHDSGGLLSKAAEELVDNFNGDAGQPRFFRNTEQFDVNSINASMVQADIKSAVASSASSSPVANTAVFGAVANGKISIDVKSEFFEAASGDFYVSVLILEDGFIAPQSRQGNNASHKKLLRAAADGLTFGKVLISGDVTEGTTFDHTFSIDMGQNWDMEKLELAAIIWKKENDRYTFINGSIFDDVQEAIVASTTELDGNFSLTAFPTLASTSVQLNIQTLVPQKYTQIQLIDINGRAVRSLYQGSLDAGEHTFQINRSNDIVAGQYFIQLQTDLGALTQPIIFK